MERVEVFYISKHQAICTREEKYSEGVKFFRKGELNKKKNPKDKKTLNPFSLLESFPPLADQSLSFPLAKT
jgi:hypothetical protein